jgi:uncharacterized protein (DUF2235 family)
MQSTRINTMTDTRTKDSGKNIVVFSDGTGQEGGEGNNTNVYKLFNMIEGRTNEQITFYDGGIGTGFRKVSAMSGVGITANILECYQFISDHYQWGDRIFLFGFSRGAATVRSLAGFISRFGILPHSRPDLATKAWKIYKMSDEGVREKNAEEFLKRNATTWCNINFLGVWDTVKALGLPNKTLDAVWNKVLPHSFHDLKLSKCVQHAYHALSIDEDREAFQPTPWQTEENDKSLLGKVYVDPRDGDASEQVDKNREQTVKQVWFCGVHTDVGGGYKESGLSDIPLAWMIDRAMDEKLLEHPLKLYPYNSVTLEQNIEGLIHSERDTWLKKHILFPEGKRSWDSKKGGKPWIHASVLERNRGKSNTEGVPYKPWILEEFKEGEYEIEPWDNQMTLYSIPVEHGYRKDSNPDGDG